MEIEISNKLTCRETPSKLRECVKETLTSLKPKWEENERMGRWNGDTQKILTCYE